MNAKEIAAIVITNAVEDTHEDYKTNRNRDVMLVDGWALGYIHSGVTQTTIFTISKGDITKSITTDLTVNREHAIDRYAEIIAQLIQSDSMIIENTDYYMAKILKWIQSMTPDNSCLHFGEYTGDYSYVVDLTYGSDYRIIGLDIRHHVYDKNNMYVEGWKSFTHNYETFPDLPDLDVKSDTIADGIITDLASVELVRPGFCKTIYDDLMSGNYHR